jgi:FemAB-related protein (PEP-CTERM system-associated)
MKQLTFERCGGRAEWSTYVANHTEATQYHGYAWLGVIREVFGHRSFPLIARDGERVVGVFPLVMVRSILFGRFLVSVPFVNYGGVLADDDEVERGLWREAVRLAEETGAAYLESRHLVPRALGDHRKQHKATMILDLAPSVDEQWRAFDTKLRNQIRKAQRSGLQSRSGGAELLSGFYEVFARCMRDLGTPVYGRRFFETILRTFPESARVFLVEANGQGVAGAISLAHRQTLEVPWAGSLREWRSRCPNNLLYWDAIRYAIDAGIRRFDFGRSTPGDGPYRFKEQWGARPVPLSWEYWLPPASPVPDLSPKNARFRTAIEVWKRLPLAVTKWVGPSVVRGIP